MNIKLHTLFATALLIALSLSSCSTAYYAAMEKIGIPKREILTSRVENAKDAQVDAQEQFKDALEAYQSVVHFDAGDLGEKYETLKSEYENSMSTAKNVSDRIEKVENVAEALFDEWEEELETYSNASLRANSQRKLRATRSEYSRLLSSMHQAEEKIEPVLTVLHDQVLFLKHNLNTTAIGSLEGEVDVIRADVDQLVVALEKSIDEANIFIDTLK